MQLKIVKANAISMIFIGRNFFRVFSFFAKMLLNSSFFTKNGKPPLLSPNLKVVVHILNKFGAGQTKWSTFIYIILGWGRKSGGATPSLVPLHNAYIDNFTILVIF